MEMAQLNRICIAMIAGQRNGFQEGGVRINIQEVRTQGIIEG